MFDMYHHLRPTSPSKHIIPKIKHEPAKLATKARSLKNQKFEWSFDEDLPREFTPPCNLELYIGSAFFEVLYAHL